MTRRRLRQVTDLYVVGKVVTLADGSPIWMQALNPFEVDAARSEGQIARARLVLSVKEFGSDEQAKVRMFFFDNGLDDARQKLIDAKVAESGPKVLERLQSDPEWTERLAILDRGLDDLARNPEGTEYELLEKLTGEYTAAISSRMQEERAFQEMALADASEETLWAQYLEWWLDRRGAEVMIAEYRLAQVFYGARWCDGRQSEQGWSHEDCAGHQELLFPTKPEARMAPEKLQRLLIDAANDVEMTSREAKNSDRQGSSSDSSPLPSEGAESTASTQTETPVAPLGSSPSPSATPSLSSASAS